MLGAIWIPLGYSVAAGALASFNPCGYAILPGFVAHYIGVEDGGTPQAGWRVWTRGLVLGLAVTLSLVVLFSAVGFIFVAIGDKIIGLYPWNLLAIGVVLLLLALRSLLKEKLPGLPWAHRALESLNVNPRSAFWFGFTYGIGSLGCTLTPFLIVAGSAMAIPGLVPAVVQFVGFGAGMGGVVIAVAVGAAFFKGTASRKMRSILPHVAELGAYLMLGAGAYLVIQWLRAMFLS